MENKIEVEKIGEILKNQGWVELHGCFTLGELQAIINQINKNYKRPEKGTKI